MVSSLNSAMILTKTTRIREFLVGSLTSQHLLDNEELDQISAIVQIPAEELPPMPYCNGRYFNANRGYEGTLFLKGENVLVENEVGDNFILQITLFFSVPTLKGCFLVASGKQFCYKLNPSGEMETNFCTGYGHVPLMPQKDDCFVLARQILRKVILYKARGALQVVADFQRNNRQLHYQVVVPPFALQMIWF